MATLLSPSPSQQLETVRGAVYLADSGLEIPWAASADDTSLSPATKTAGISEGVWVVVSF